MGSSNRTREHPAEPALDLTALEDLPFAPVHGVSIERYADLTLRIGQEGFSPVATDWFLEAEGVPAWQWRLVCTTWNERMALHPDVHVRFNELYRDKLRTHD